MKKLSRIEVREVLEEYAAKYNHPSFIESDPISIPKRFSKKEDIEIAGFFASILAWGQRKTIMNKCHELLERMDHDPHQFILHHTEDDLEPFLTFKHRTFNDLDTLYFLSALQRIYRQYGSLENAFCEGATHHDHRLNLFFERFFDDEDAPQRTRKHVACPNKKSACKRINMYLRWMVRKDEAGVDFGIWNRIVLPN